MSIWEKFEGIASAEEVVQAVNTRKPLPEGDYRMILKKIEPSESQNGLPMLKGEFQMIDGGRKVFYNQILQNTNYPYLTAKNIANAVAFISGLTGEHFEFTSMAELESAVYEIGLETEHNIRVAYRANDVDKKYPELSVVEEIEDPVDNGDVAF